MSAPYCYGTIREFKTRNFRVVVDALEDWDTDLSFDETGEVREKLERGEYICFTVRARVFYNGQELAADYLGGCIYENIGAFQDHRECGAETRRLRASGSTAAVCGSYFAGMVHGVCKQARKTIQGFHAVRVRA